MIHVILTILKIIGILLLALLLLLAAILLSVLLVPLRYRLTAAHTDTDTGGEVCVTWLLHLLSVRFALKAGENARGTDPGGTDSEDTAMRPEQLSLPHMETIFQVRIFGIPLERIRDYLKKRKNKKKKRKRQKAQQAFRQQAAHPDEKKQQQSKQRQKEKEQSKQKQSKQKQTEQKQAEQQSREQQHYEKPQPEQRQSEQRQSEQRQSERRQPETHSDKWQDDPSGEEDGRPSAFLDKIKNFFRNRISRFQRFGDRIKNIPDRFRHLYRTIRKLLLKPGEILRTIADFLQKLEEYEAVKVLGQCQMELGRLLHHFRVRKGSGYLRFGTGDPARTGELTGFLYLLIPVSCGEISIEPQFTETMLEANISVQGHIRLVHLAGTAWWAFRNKELLRLIQAFRRR